MFWVAKALGKAVAEEALELGKIFLKVLLFRLLPVGIELARRSKGGGTRGSNGKKLRQVVEEPVRVQVINCRVSVGPCACYGDHVGYRLSKLVRAAVGIEHAQDISCDVDICSKAGGAEVRLFSEQEG